MTNQGLSMITYSIIIPHYNSPKSLRKLLFTIPNFRDIEVIVIDDRSDKHLDDYQELIRDFSHKNIKFQTNNSCNKGAGACRNIGINEALGKWLLFADSDDFFVKGFYDVIKKNSEENSDVIYFIPSSLDLITMSKSNRHIYYEKITHNFLKNKPGSELKLRYNFEPPWSKLIKKDIVLNNEVFFDEIIAANDVMFSVKLGFYSNQIKASKESIYVVTKGVGTLTQDTSLNVYLARVATFIAKSNYLKEKLSKKQLKKLKLRGARGFVLLAIENKYGLKVIKHTMKKFKENNIKYYLIDYFNLLVMFQKIFIHLKRIIQDKVYRV